VIKRSLPYALLASLLVSGCSTLPDAATRLNSAQAVAATQGWQARRLRTDTFRLQAWVPAARPTSETLTVYVEGDGLAWLGSGTPSDDPTPVRPMVLRMAMAQPGGNAVYLGRPCHYTRDLDAQCAAPYWTAKRFAEEVITAMDQGLDALKRERGATHLVLVGYSGGGAVTALLAERRHDVSAWITVAGNIDTHAWTEQHRLSPLAGSLDPMTTSARLRELPQWHFVGRHDAVVPAALVERFASHMPHAQVIARDYDHLCCWAQDWAQAYPLKP
jgi:dienelactone hydrolase